MPGIAHHKPRRRKDTIKFMQVVHRDIYRQLEREAKNHGNVTPQELLRVLIIPFWFKWKDHFYPRPIRFPSPAYRRAMAKVLKSRGRK